MKPMLFAALCLAGVACAGPVQAQYAPYPYAVYPASPPPPAALPPSWSYDPYTSGQAPCPQKRPGDLESCAQIMPPTYGQPSYWPNR